MVDRIHDVLQDSARWDGFEFRDGDIVISTPAKCGTTWTQRIVSLLLFDSVELPQPLARISPWLDMNTRSLADVRADLDGQTHRRFIKSHLAYDYLPHDDRVTYITVGRDPRDVAISMAHHLDNVDFVNFLQERAAAVGLDDLADMAPPELPDLSARPADRFWHWMEGAGKAGLEGLVEHLQSFWNRRSEPNIVLLHYADLQRDLVGQMAYLATRLGVERPRERLEELAPAASFEAMKASAADVAPNGDQTFWKDTGSFFHTGANEQWRDVIAEEDLPRYDKRIGELVDAEFGHWLHHGTHS